MLLLYLSLQIDLNRSEHARHAGFDLCLHFFEQSDRCSLYLTCVNHVSHLGRRKLRRHQVYERCTAYVFFITIGLQFDHEYGEEVDEA